MQYMMFVATDPDAEPYDPAQDNIQEWVKLVEERGAHLHGDRLRPVEDATLVRVRDGELIVSDGPFAETREWIAGYDVLECENLDEAIELASKHPMARFGRLELRPFWPFDPAE